MRGLPPPAPSQAGCAMRRETLWTDERARGPAPAVAQSGAGRLVAGGGPEECRALVPACAGLVPFVTEALRKLAELCARLPSRA